MTRRAAAVAAVVSGLIVGCSELGSSEDRARAEATASVTTAAEQLRLEFEVATKTTGLDGVRQIIRTIESYGPASSALIDGVVEREGKAVVAVSLRSRKQTGGGLTYADATVILCVEYQVDLSARGVRIHDRDCPDKRLGESFAGGGAPDEVSFAANLVDKTRLTPPPVTGTDEPSGPFDRVGEEEEIAEAEAALPAVRAAMTRLTEGGQVRLGDVTTALQTIDGITSVQAREDPSSRGVYIGASVGDACIVGIVAPADIDLSAAGHLADGGCLPPKGF